MSDTPVADQARPTPPSSISVTATAETISVTATTENKGTEVNGTQPDKAWVAASLGLGIALSVVRYVQQRLKYTKLVYRTALVLAEFPLEST
jgi:hypothetical protein